MKKIIKNLFFVVCVLCITMLSMSLSVSVSDINSRNSVLTGNGLMANLGL